MDHKKLFGWKSLVVAIMCIFCIYKMDQIALDTDSRQTQSGKKTQNIFLKLLTQDLLCRKKSKFEKKITA